MKNLFLNKCKISITTLYNGILIFLMCYISACGDDDNGVPIANAGPDQMVTSGAMVTLDGSGSSDPNGDVLGYSWSADSNNPSEVGLRSKTTVSPTFTAPSTAGAYTFTLVVDDGVARSSPDMVTITVDTSTSNNNTAQIQIKMPPPMRVPIKRSMQALRLH